MLITKDNIKDFSLGLSLSSGDVVQFDIDCYLLEYVYTSDVEGCKLSFRGDANGIFNATPNPDYVVTEGGMLGTVLRLLGCCAADIKVFYRLVYGPDSKLVFPYFPLACLRSTFKAACAPMYTLNAVVMVFKLMGYSVHPSFDLGPEFYEFMVKIRDLSYNGRSDFVLGSRFAVGQKLHLADIDVLRRYHADKVLLLSAGSAVVVSQVYRVRYSYIFTSGDLDDCVRYTFFIGNTPFFLFLCIILRSVMNFQLRIIMEKNVKMLLDYKNQKLLDSSAVSDRDVCAAVLKTDLSLQQSLLETYVEYLDAQERLRGLKSCYPLDLEAIATASGDVSELKAGVDLIMSLRKEFGFSEVDLESFVRSSKTQDRVEG